VSVHANRLDLTPARVFVRDQTTRWGSCSTSGALSFSWRLVLAPPFVLDYLAAHEVAHLAHMNHGPRFWAFVERTMPRHDEARVWLRKHGASLHRYGAEGMPPSSPGRSPKRSIE
jgi:predicted metal-dependent hydrolase